VTPSAQLVIGCSEQLPNELRAYRLLGASSEGAVLLSRNGAMYSAARGEVCHHGQLLERMLGKVLENLPLDFRPRARVALTRRWNRDWGVEAEDLIQGEAGGDRPGADASANGSAFATESVESSSSPPAPSEPMVEGMDPSSRKPPSSTVSDPVLTDVVRVDHASLGSFLAREPRAWISRDGWRPPADSEDPDGGQIRERARRRRHID
jgi:hypothetical protein